MSSLYTSHGFSKRIIRKLQHLPFVQSIQVWSLWHAESFYKRLGFRHVVQAVEAPTTHPGKQVRKKKSFIRNVEGEWGPLLVWNKEDRTLKTKDSLVSLVGGVGALGA